MSNIKIFKEDDFELATRKNIIGKGTYGIVHCLHKNETEELFAVKFLESDFDNFEQLFFREIKLLSKLQYPTLVRQYGIIVDPPALVTEYVPNKTIQDYIDKAFQGKSVEGWNMSHKIIIILGISFGMKYLHSEDIIHRDLKPENILLDLNFYPKICDFGLAKIAKGSVTMTTNVGTPPFCAPEMILKNECDGKKADVYSFAMTIYSIFHNRLPFQDEDPHLRLNLILEIEKGKRPIFHQDDISQTMKELIEKCWDQNPEKRPDFDVICDVLLKEVDNMIAENKVQEEEIQKFLSFCNIKYSFIPKNKESLLEKIKKEIEEDEDCIFFHGFSLIHFAAKENLIEIGELLISKGADINEKNIIYL